MDSRPQGLGARVRRLPLFWQIFLPTAVVLALAAVVLLVSPAAVSSEPSEAQVIGFALAIVAIVFVILVVIRQAVGPLERLAEVMARVDPLAPGERAPTTGGSAETVQLAEVFNAMLDRIETERRESGARMLSATERERVRLARELHDEIGQSITGLMLELDQAAARAPDGVAKDLRETQEAARAIGDELREIVRRLRPEALDDLGLHSALVALTEQFADSSGVLVERRLGPRLTLDDDAELVVYRVAQESLTNVARHAGAASVTVELADRGDVVELVVADDGRGLASAPAGNGIRGMRERAILIGGRLAVASTPRGAEVRLTIPTDRSAT
jgi:two-component system sensor histidine kinase UhpB